MPLSMEQLLSLRFSENAVVNAAFVSRAMILQEFAEHALR